MTIERGLFGCGIDTFGESQGCDRISPANLPQADVVITDCEGAERDIIPHIGGVSPAAAVIETRGRARSPPDAIADILTEIGYEVVDRVAASRRSDTDKENVTLLSVPDDNSDGEQ